MRSVLSRMVPTAGLLAVGMAAGCGNNGTSPGEGGRGKVADAGSTPDARPRDAGQSADAGGGRRPDGGSGTDAGAGADAGGNRDAGDAGPTLDAGGKSGLPPKITRIAWKPDEDCAQGDPALIMVALTVTDADTDPVDLEVSGEVENCDALTELENEIECEQDSPNAGTVTVRDPEGNSDTVSFTMNVCASGTWPL